MALTSDYVYKFMLLLARKNQSGSISAGDFGNFWNAAQNAFFADLMGRFNKSSNSKLRGQTGLIENETIMTKLAPLIRTTSLAPSAGVVTKPSDFVYALALRINGFKVFQVDHDQVWAINDDVIDPPSIAEDSYYYTEYQGGYSLLPATVTSNMDLDYICYPPLVSWIFTNDSSGRQVYDPINSVGPVWNNVDASEITQRALKLLGVSFKSEDMTRFGESTIETGD